MVELEAVARMFQKKMVTSRMEVKAGTIQELRMLSLPLVSAVTPFILMEWEGASLPGISYVVHTEQWF